MLRRSLRHPLAPLLIALLATPCLHADGPSPGDAIKEFDLGPGQHSRIVCVDMTGDLVPDILTLSNGQLQFFYGPGHYSWKTTIPFPVLDIAVVPSSAPGESDSVLVNNITGIYHLFFSYDAAAYEGLPGYNVLANTFVAHQLDSSARWSDTERILGLARGNTYLAAGFNNGEIEIIDDVFGDFDVTPHPETFGELIDWSLINWDAVDPVDIAVVAHDRVAVVSVDGDVHLDLPVSFERGATLHFNGSEELSHRLVGVLRPAGQASDWLYVLREGPGLVQAFDLGPVSTAGIAIGDLNGDDLGDLVVNHMDGHDLHGFMQIPGDPSFTALESETLPLFLGDGPANGELGWPTVCDLDGDLDEDVAVNIDTLDRLAIRFSQHASRELMEVTLPPPNPPGTTAGSYEIKDSPSVHGLLTFDYTPPPIQPFEGDPTNLEVIVWLQPNPDAKIQSDAIFNEKYDWSASQVELQIPLEGEDDPVTDKIFWIQLRAVRIEPGTGDTVSSGPMSFFGFSTSLAVTIHVTQNGELDFDEIALPGVDLEREGGGAALTPVDDPGQFEETDPPSPGPGSF